MLVHGWPWVYWDDSFRGWRAVAQSTVWPDRVVVPPPFFDDDLSLLQGVEDLSIKQFVPEAGIEGLAVSVLPRRAGFNVGGFGSDSMERVPWQRTRDCGLIWVGMRRRMNRSVRALTTSVALRFLLTPISRYSPLNTSRMFHVRKTLPSSVRWCTKSYCSPSALVGRKGLIV